MQECANPVKRIVVSDYDPAWPGRYEFLRNRVWPAVRDLAVAIEHVGSTSVPGLTAKPVIDIDVVVRSQEQIPAIIAKLKTLEYEYRGNQGVAGREVFRAAINDPPHHLYVCLADSPALRNHLVLRDYLRSHPEAVAAYGELKKRLACQFPSDMAQYIWGKTDFVLGILGGQDFPPEQLQAIRETNRKPLAFAAPCGLGKVMRRFPAPWYVAGGWALDLFLEIVTRPHGDIEMLVLRENQTLLHRHLHGFQLSKIIPRPEGGSEAPWEGELLEPPIHQVRARSAQLEVDIFLGDTSGDKWVYRRDPRVTLPRSEIGGQASFGPPFLAPEIVLLFKAKHFRPKDETDFACVMAQLPESGKHWLRGALQTAHPECPWLESLKKQGPPVSR